MTTVPNFNIQHPLLWKPWAIFENTVNKLFDLIRTYRGSRLLLDTLEGKLMSDTG
jgi:hypothetical protein